MKGICRKGKPGKLETFFSSCSCEAPTKVFVHFCNAREQADLLMDKGWRKKITIIVMLLDITRILARQGLAFRGDNDDDSNFVQIVNLNSRHNPTIKAWMNSKSKRKYKPKYMSPRSQYP